MFRLFVGLALPESLRDHLARLSQGLPGARWVDPENFHITLRFIGEVDRHTAADIDGTLQRIDSTQFVITAGGLGAFGQGRKTRALWTRVDATEALSHLQGKVESAVVRAGQPPESRKFLPHITVARFRGVQPDRLQSYIERNSVFHAKPVTIDRFVLFESHMGKGGSHYEALEEYPLYPAADSEMPKAEHAAS